MKPLSLYAQSCSKHKHKSWHWRGVSPLLSHQGVNANVTTLTEGRHYPPYGPLQQNQHEEGLFADRELSREQSEHLVR